jgi:hypothetical protein
MMNFRLLGAIALSLTLATPAMADSDFVTRGYPTYYNGGGVDVSNGSF